MLASRAALQADEDAGARRKPRVSFHSAVVRGRQPAQAISVPLHGVEEIYLYVTGAPDVEYGAADWIAPRIVDANGKETLVCADKFIDLQEGFHTVDCSLRSRVDPPLRIADKEYPHGINIQAQGVPCNTGVIVGMMYKMNADGSRIRQIVFEQDHTYNPTVMPDGRGEST